MSTLKPIASPLIFGEVLFDCLPNGLEVIGGAPFNVAWNLQALGMKPIIITRIGDDARGQKVIDAMNHHQMDMQGVQIDAQYSTGYVQVSLHDGEPDYEIVAPVAYDHIRVDELPPIKNASLLYHGSLALRNKPSRHALKQLIAKCKTPIFLDVNLRKPWYDLNIVKSMAQQATWCKLNRSEFTLLHQSNHASPSHLFTKHLKTIYLTKGAKGASMITKAGETNRITPPKAANIADLIGAGDAFSS